MTHTKYNSITKVIYKYRQNKRYKGRGNINKEEVMIKNIAH